MGTIARACMSLAAALLIDAADADDTALARFSLTLPAGFRYANGSDDSREWVPERPTADSPVRIVVLERERESWDDAAGSLRRLHRTLSENCPHARIEEVTRRVPANAQGAVRGILTCPTHSASGRGLVVVDDVITVGDRFLIVKVAFDYEPFSAGVKPLSSRQRMLAFSVLDSIAIAAAQ